MIRYLKDVKVSTAMRSGLDNTLHEIENIDAITKKHTCWRPFSQVRMVLLVDKDRGVIVFVLHVDIYLARRFKFVPIKIFDWNLRMQNKTVENPL